MPNQRWKNVVYFKVGIYNVEQHRNNVLRFNVDINNVRQRRNNVTIFKVEFHNVVKRPNNVLKMTISKKNKSKIFQIEYTEFKVLTTISQPSLYVKNMSKSTCKAEKIFKRSWKILHFKNLKSDSHLPKQIILYASMKALWKWWKMLLISS